MTHAPLWTAFDPAKSVAEQQGTLAKADPEQFDRLHSEYSAICESHLKDQLHPLKQVFFGFNGEILLDAGHSDEGVPSNHIPEGFVKKDGTLQLAEAPQNVRSVIPVYTPWMDSRLHPFKGNTEKLSAYLGCLMATHIRGQLEKIKADTGASFYILRHFAEVYMSLPVKLKHTLVNKLAMSPETPSLRGKVYVVLIQQ